MSSLSAMQKAVVTETIANAMVDIYTNPSLKDLKSEVFCAVKEDGNVKVSGASADVTIKSLETATESGEVSVTVEASTSQSSSGYIVAITMPEGVSMTPSALPSTDNMKPRQGISIFIATSAW